MFAVKIEESRITLRSLLTNDVYVLSHQNFDEEIENSNIDDKDVALTAVYDALADCMIDSLGY